MTRALGDYVWSIGAAAGAPGGTAAPARPRRPPRASARLPLRALPSAGGRRVPRLDSDVLLFCGSLGLAAAAVLIFLFLLRAPAARPLRPRSFGRTTSVEIAVGGAVDDRPTLSNREPWQGQSQVFSASFQATMQPRCGHTAESAQHGAARSLVHGDLVDAAPEERAGVARDVRNFRRVASGDPIRVLRRRVRGFAHERTRRADGLARGVVERGPGVLPSEDQIGQAGSRRSSRASGRCPSPRSRRRRCRRPWGSGR